MEEYNLDRDAQAYQGSLQAYQNDLYKKANLQAKLNKEADEQHEAWATPVDLLSGEFAGKPIKSGIKALGKKLAKKGLKKAGAIAENRLKQAGQKLADNMRAKLPQTTTLDDAKNSLTRTSGEADSSLRNSLNRLRGLQGQNSISQTPTTDTEPISPKTDGVDPADVPTSIDTTAPAPAEPQEVNLADEPSALDADQNDAVSAIMRGENPASALFKYRMKTMDVPTASSAQSAQPEADDLAGDVTSQSLQAPKTLAQGALDASKTADVGSFLSGAEESGAKVATKVASTAGADVGADLGAEAGAGVATGLAEGAGAAAIAEGGLNPIADLIAIGSAIAGFFGASHKAPAKQVQFRPTNPSMQYGI